MIIGERKCGTSSLYRYLITHPNLLPAKQKETAYFSRSWKYVRKNIDTYLDHFPNTDNEGISLSWIELNDNGELFEEAIDYSIERGQHYITGEASANTFSTVHPAKVHSLFPEMKLVVMLREPVNRAISQHGMYRRFKKEGRKWSWLVGSLQRDLWLEKQLFRLGMYFGPFLGASYYARNLRRWLSYFPMEQFFVIRTEDLTNAKSAQLVMNDLCKFLGIASHDFADITQERFNKSKDNKTPAAIRELIGDVFRKPNRELEDLLGREMNWQ